MASTDLPATLVQQIASNVLSVPAAAIPWEVVEHTKALIVDSIGCALAAVEEPAFARVGECRQHSRRKSSGKREAGVRLWLFAYRGNIGGQVLTDRIRFYLFLCQF